MEINYEFWSEKDRTLELFSRIEDRETERQFELAASFACLMYDCGREKTAKQIVCQLLRVFQFALVC